MPLRVMFDENMSSKVAKALALLDKDVVNTRPARPDTKGRSDLLVARDAREQGRYIFSANFDMIVAAINEGAPVIWFFDRKDNVMTRFETARLWFRKWDYWERVLSPPDARCLRVSRDRSTVVPPEKALEQASRLDRRQKKIRSQAAVKRSGEQQLLDFDD